MPLGPALRLPEEARWGEAPGQYLLALTRVPSPHSAEGVGIVWVEARVSFSVLLGHGQWAHGQEQSLKAEQGVQVGVG